MIQKVLNFSCLVPFNADASRVALLKRSASKKLHPNHYSGIGGNVELDELINLPSCIEREWGEETNIPWAELSNVRHWLTMSVIRGDSLYIMHWYSGCLANLRTFPCDEGDVELHTTSNLPSPLTSPAQAAIRYMVDNWNNPLTSPQLALVNDATAELTFQR
ncbi:MAG: NUDIX hydrolase [Alphaproteobacteria bacterium]